MATRTPTPFASPQLDPFAPARATGDASPIIPTGGATVNTTTPNYRETGTPTGGGAVTPSFRGAFYTGNTAVPRGSTGAATPDLSGLDLNRLFSDPATADLERLLTSRLGSLESPISTPERDAQQSLLSGYRDAGASPDEQALQESTRSRIDFLHGDPFTAPEEKAIQVANLDRLERDRQDAKRREADRLMRLGHEPSSGTITAALREIDHSFDLARAQTQTDLNLFTISEKQKREQEATGLGQMLTDLARSGQDRTAGFADQAAGVETTTRNEGEARQREALQTAALPNELTLQRLNLALQALGLGSAQGNSLLPSLLGIAGANNEAASQRSQGWGQFANLLTTLAGTQGGSGSATAPARVGNVNSTIDRLQG